MVTQNELKAFYEIDLKSKLLFFEEQRKLLISKLKFLGIIYGILIIFTILTMIIAGNLEVARIATTICMVFILIAIINFFRKMKSSYQAHFKKAIIGPLVTFIDQNLSYAPEKTIKVEAFHTSQLFKQEYEYGVDEWTGEDYVSGILSGTNVKFGEVHAQEVVYDEGEYYDGGYYDGGYYDGGYYDGGYYDGAEAHTVTVFKGLFFIFDVNWDFDGITFILPNDGEQGT